jgi:hypothetical protein
VPIIILLEENIYLHRQNVKAGIDGMNSRDHEVPTLSDFTHEDRNAIAVSRARAEAEAHNGELNSFHGLFTAFIGRQALF